MNGARRWIAVGPAVFQPSELAKLALAIWAAATSRDTAPPQTLGELAKPFGLLACLFAGLLVLEPDLGTAIAIVLMLVRDAARRGHAGAARSARRSRSPRRPASFAIWLEPYRRARFFAFLHPWHDAQASGFQIVQAMIGMGSGGIFGVGLGQGVQKIFYLPEAHTDMMLANIGEELGPDRRARGARSRTSLFAYAGLKIALGCRDPFGKRLAAGLTVLVCGQAAVNVGRRDGRRAADRESRYRSSPTAARASWCCSRRSGSSLTSRIVAMQRQLRCVIAAGGTAGHVLPALAVAEALTTRGVFVTFAGSPDRVEARLVPDAGYELDTFRDQRLPAAAVARRSLRALCAAGVAPSACRAILRRRRPDVVLGGGGYVAGPMVLAARVAADPGGADRGRRALRAREPARRAVREARSSSPIRCDGHDGAKYRVVGRPIPARRARDAAGPRRARSSSCRRTGRCCSSPARSPARTR